MERGSDNEHLPFLDFYLLSGGHPYDCWESYERTPNLIREVMTIYSSMEARARKTKNG